MDDSLEVPNSKPHLEEEQDQSSDDEDGGLDWTKIM